MATGPSDRYDSHRRLNQPAVDEKSRRWRDHWRARSPVTSVSNRLQDSIRLSCGSRSVGMRCLVRRRNRALRGFSCGFPLLDTDSARGRSGAFESGPLAGSARRIRFPSRDDLWASFLYGVGSSGTARRARCSHSPAARSSTPQSSCCRRRTVMTGALRR